MDEEMFFLARNSTKAVISIKQLNFETISEEWKFHG